MSDPVTRINALTNNARNTWFALLAALVFVGVTLLSVKPIDFYGVGRATQLPLVGVSVPTNFFFYAAPALTVAIYGYFHLYLIRLWDALSEAPARINGTRLSDAAAPWLITDSAVAIRQWLRRDYCSTPRTLSFPNGFWNLCLAWIAGHIVLFFLWYLSLPARDTVMSGISAFTLILGQIFGTTSAIQLYRRMRRPPPEDRETERQRVALWVALVYLLPAIFLISHTWHATWPTGRSPAVLDLTGEEIVKRPAGWKPYALAKIDFFQNWCKRDAKIPCIETQLTPDQQGAFQNEWSERRKIALADLQKPEWSQPSSTRIMDLRDAQMISSFLSGARLIGAQMDRANLSGAQMEGAVLSGAQMEGADLFRAQMEGADLSFAQMEGADLFRAQMEGAVLSGAQMEGAVLSGAQMEGAVLSGAQMEGAVLSFSHLTGTPDQPTVLESTNLSAGTNNGGALRFVDLTQIKFNAETDFRNAVMDGSVQMTDAFKAQLGDACQMRLDEVLSDEDFHGLWRAWLEHPTNPQPVKWPLVASEGFENVPPATLPAGCTWQTGPIVPEASD